MKPIIRVRGISKRYVIGRNPAHRMLRESLAQAATVPLRIARSALRQNHAGNESGRDQVWALRDVSFDVNPGEVLGIIGRNGAGKSTLLKILSRITDPTEGRAELDGRVGSLLEVGTGFHPELTGRENLYLSGTILGMRRAEIARKFHEIVDFAGVEKFIDTPVKHYSSGMYVRLAFAVAAYLETEILLVDEVLAVGDAAFQKKCLGKMREVSKGGRTVLFVSHNMEVILKLCTRGILMGSGQILQCDAASRVAASYLEEHVSSSSRTLNLKETKRPLDTMGGARFAAASPVEGRPGWALCFGQNLAFDIQIEAKKVFENIELGVALSSVRGFEVASWTSTCSGVRLPLKLGNNIIRVQYQDLTILPGQYYLGLGLRTDRGFEDYIAEAVWFEILVSDNSAILNTHTFAGIIVPTVKAELRD